ncbi:MAG TPA: VIT family protein [Candidatus Angelobacter sp.]
MKPQILEDIGKKPLNGPPRSAPMADYGTLRSKRVLDPIDRFSEILFGLIMVLTVTCSLSVTGADRRSVHTMLLAAIGCNLAWGIIDAMFYLMACMSERGHKYKLLQRVRRSADAAAGRHIIASAMPPLLASLLPLPDLERLRRRLVQMPDPAGQRWLTLHDWYASFWVFLLVFLSTFPLVIPFIVIHQPSLALRVSNGIGIIMLFVLGYAFGRHAGKNPWGIGVAMVALGVAMVGLTIRLGG